MVWYKNLWRGDNTKYSLDIDCHYQYSVVIQPYKVEVDMCITLVGGMDRLAKHYQGEAKKQGVKLNIFSQAQSGMENIIRKSDAVVLFTNKVSHQARNAAVAEAKKRDIPLYQYHSCGLCTLRDCLSCIKNQSIQ